MAELRQVLGDPGTRLRATFVLLPRVEIVECLAAAGFGAVVVDLEHGPIAPADLPPLVAAGQAAGLYVLVRVPDAAPGTIGAVLDTGADGVVVPHTGSAGEAAAVVRAARLPPEGDRSINPYVRAAAYRGERADPAVLVMVEGRAGVAALPQITAVTGLDAVFVGPIDLSAALGLQGQPEHPDVVAEAGRIIAAAGAAGLATGVYCPTPAAARRWLRAGARIVVLLADLAMAYDGFVRQLAAVDKEDP